MTQQKKLIATVDKGTDYKMETQWPRWSQVERIQEGKRVYWLATYNICNGIAGGSHRFHTKAAALLAIQ